MGLIAAEPWDKVVILSMWNKVNSKFIIEHFRSGIESYSNFTKEVGLWKSEKYVFQKYINKTNRILDLGCGTGRTTFPLYKLGYKDIIGIDLTPEMIHRAKELNDYFQTKIEFEIGDARDLIYPDSNFDVVIFSFNGLMSVPSQVNRSKAILEINRVLKESGFFIFTSFDREKEEQFLSFWNDQKEIWKLGKQDPKLYEFGDLIIYSKKEDREIFIHVPSEDEVKNWLTENNFELVETFYRKDKFNENEKVKAKAGECRFWIARKSTQ